MILELLAAVCVLVGLGVGGVGLRQIRDAIRVATTPLQDAVELSGGYGKIEGRTAVHRDTVTAPLTRTECLAYEVALQNRNSTDTGPVWEDKHTTTESVPFLLTDRTGEVVVDPVGASRNWETDHKRQFDSEEPPTGSYTDFVDDHDIYTFDDEGISEEHRIRFVEKRIDIDDELAVVGPVDDSGIQRQIRKKGDGLLQRPFSIADDQSEQVKSPIYGLFLLVIGLLFALAGSWFAWKMLGLG